MASSNSLESFDTVLLSVQELIKKPLVSIPHQYVRPNQETLTISDGPAFPSLPIIDMKLLLSTETTKLELQKLHSSCKEWGFFQLVNHGINTSLLEKLRYDTEEFYKLPMEEKMKYKIRPGDFEGYGTLTRLEGKLDWGDRIYMIFNPTQRRKSHLFPELPSSFKNCLENYLPEMQKLAMNLLEFIAKALNINLKDMEETFNDGMQSMRMSYYPPCPQPELVTGLTPHSDGSGITILNQLNGVDGLQIKKGGVWLPVRFLPDALVVNVGDILEILSNGVYKSVEHRAMVNSEKERISIAVFFNPKFEAEFGPAKCLINAQNPAIFKRITMEEYVKAFFSQKLNGKSLLERMKIQAGNSSQEPTLHG